jgi:succinyl-CoA synthetase beta subunit
MKLREYQAKRIFSNHGIAVPEGATATSPDQVESLARDLGGPVVLKPQLGVKGRGKVGGIGFADDPAAARAEAERLFALVIKGETVRTMLVEARAAIAQEIYLAVTVDTSARCPVLIASAEGGVEIEVVARERPERVLRLPIDIRTGPDEADLARVAGLLGQDVADLAKILYGIFRSFDAEIVEINPLVRTVAGGLLAVDAVLNVNEDSVDRHEDLLALRDEIPVEDPIAEEASRSGWTYIDLGGDIGILSSGAGLTMAILDLINGAGGTAANFLDTAQIDDEGIIAAFDLLRRARPTKVLLINVFAGLNRCDVLAEGIRKSITEHPPGIPIVVRMVGNLEEAGHRILGECGLEPYTGLEDAVDAAVRLSKEVAR